MNIPPLPVLIPQDLIHSRVRELAAQIQQDYEGKPLTVLGIFSGSFIFLADLLRQISIPLQMESLIVSSYVGQKSTGVLRIESSKLTHLAGRDILVVDDILETGLTFTKIRQNLIQLKPAPRSIEFCVLLRKDCIREHPITARYVGFDIANEFVVGYGLDFEGRYRNLPYIGIFSPESGSVPL